MILTRIRGLNVSDTETAYKSLESERKYWLMLILHVMRENREGGKFDSYNMLEIDISQ